MDKAHPAQVAQAKAAPARTRTAPAAGERTDYTDPKFAGNPHRGRVTEEEATYVREHLDEVNKRLSAEGLRMIDPVDPKQIKRYGLNQKQ